MQPEEECLSMKKCAT